MEHLYWPGPGPTLWDVETAEQIGGVHFSSTTQWTKHSSCWNRHFSKLLTLK